jgi:hypothetical protein
VSGDRPGWDDAAIDAALVAAISHFDAEDYWAEWSTETLREAFLAGREAGLIEATGRDAAVRADERTRIADGIAERCDEVYPPDVFIPVTPEDVRAYHAGFEAAGLSVDQWSAHIMRHAHRIIAEEVREGGRSPCS